MHKNDRQKHLKQILVSPTMPQAEKNEAKPKSKKKERKKEKWMIFCQQTLSVTWMFLYNNQTSTHGCGRDFSSLFFVCVGVFLLGTIKKTRMRKENSRKKRSREQVHTRKIKRAICTRKIYVLLGNAADFSNPFWWRTYQNPITFILYIKCTLIK